MSTEMSRKQLQRALDASEVEYLFDARSEEDYERSHILGAESLPLGSVEQGVGLPSNKDARIVFYCGGGG